MKKTIKRITAMMLVLGAVLSAFVMDFGVPTNEDGEKSVGVVAYAATQVMTGGFNGNNYSTKHTVYVSRNKTAKVKVCTFNQSGNRTSGNFTIKVTTPYDSNFVKYISGTSTNKITLNFGYDRYYLQIKRRGTGSTNIANCYWWSFDATSNCWFW